MSRLDDEQTHHPAETETGVDSDFFFFIFYFYYYECRDSHEKSGLTWLARSETIEVGPTSRERASRSLGNNVVLLHTYDDTL